MCSLLTRSPRTNMLNTPQSLVGNIHPHPPETAGLRWGGGGVVIISAKGLLGKMS